MNPATDFARIYSELGVSPLSGLDAFKQAYRRRVAELHPDRPATGPRDPDRLIALNLGYAAALEFHRAHGRLPGAPPLQAGGDHGEPGVLDGHHRRDASMPSRAAPGSAAWTRILLPVLIVFAASWYWVSEFEPGPAATAPEAAATTAPAEAVPDIRLELGMDPRTVAAVLGEPVARNTNGSHWIYGPSWVRFECGRLSDWYSAPLHPLHVATQRPEPETRHDRARSAAGGRRRACLDPAHGSPGGAQQVHGGD
jgi:hypothetical protein